MASLLDKKALKEYKDNAMNPNHPEERGSAQNPDIFFQAREASNVNYNNMPKIVEGYMNAINAMIGTNYKLFSYYGDKTANHVIIAMGSVCQTIEEYIDFMNKKKKVKIGLIEVHLYRPFSKEHLLKALPSTVKTISVLDRTKEPGAFGEPLYQDVVTALKGTKFDKCKILGGRYGLGSKNTTPEQIAAVYANKTQNGFTIGIKDDVTKLSLKEGTAFNSTPEGTTCCKFWGLGSDGTVGAKWLNDWKAPDYNMNINLNLIVRLKELNPNNFIEKANNRYNELRKTYLSTNNLVKRYQDYYNILKLSGAAEREENKWSEDSDINGDELNFEREIDYITDWIKQHMQYLDTNIFPKSTDIRNIQSDNADYKMYNLQGQEVNGNQKGLFIRGGKKYIIK